MASKGDCDELETVKTIIRALLIADKRPLTLNQFLCEFKSSEGQELPFKKYGFGDALNFLRSLPDTVHLTERGSAGELYVRPTVTKDVQHIQNLVCGQKTSKPLVNRTPTTVKHASSLKKGQYVQNLNGQKTSKALMPQQAMASQGDCAELETIKTIIRALLIADKRPLTLCQFLCEFKSSEGQELPFKQYGFGNPLDFLRSLPDTVHLTKGCNENDIYVRPTITRDVQHVHNLVNGQKTSKPLVNCPPSTAKQVKKVQHIQNLVNCQKTSKPLANRPPNTVKQANSLNKGQHLQNPVNGQKASKSSVVCPPTTCKSANTVKKVQHVQNLASSQKTSKTLVNHPPTTSKPVDCVSQPQPMPQAPALPQQPPKSQSPLPLEETKDNLRQLLADHLMKGISVLQLDEVYAHRFDSSIGYVALGYSTIEDFVVNMPDIFFPTLSSTGVMHVFASRYYRQPPVPGRQVHFSRPSIPAQRHLPCFQVHRAPTVQRRC